MATEEKTYTITHHQWEWFNGLDAKYRELQKESEDRKQALLKIKEGVRELHEKYRAELAERAELIVTQTMKATSQQDASRRNAAALVLALRALESLHNAATTVDCCAACVGNVEGFLKAMQEAGEVLAAHGFPF